MGGSLRPWTQAVIVLGALGIVGFGAGMLLLRSTAPDPIDVSPLGELVGGLDVVEEPRQHCPESATSCWGSVVVSSGVTQNDTIGRAWANVQEAGYVPFEDPQWPGAERDGTCVRLGDPELLKVYDAETLPADAMYLTIDAC